MKKDELAYSANHTYREGYDDAITDTKAGIHGNMANAIGVFMVQCGEMAEKNWCQSQVDMLQRLFGAVIHGCDYDEWEP